MERKKQIDSLSKIINTLQAEGRFDLYNDIMNLVSLCLDLNKEWKASH